MEVPEDTTESDKEDLLMSYLGISEGRARFHLGHRVRTEDGQWVGEGDQVFDYYNMAPGVVGRIEGEHRAVYHDPLMQGSTDPWFTVTHDNGAQKTLNGQRICSLDGARKKGWYKA